LNFPFPDGFETHAETPVTRGLLVINAGSSSIKFALYALNDTGPALRFRGLADGLGGSRAHLEIVDDQRRSLLERDLEDTRHDHALERVVRWIENHLEGVQLVGAGHRVVHGGARFSRPVRLDARTLDRLEGYTNLAPLHQPHNLRAIHAVARLRPNLPQVACFDTAVHRQQPPVAQRFALPREYEEKGILRYGFHGLSYEYIASVLADYDPRGARGRTVVAHLGNGASMCALHNGRSVATTMGFTALDGLPMGERCGSIDPGVLLFLLQHEGLSVSELEELLYRRSGLLGLSGISSDMRELLASDQPAARDAVDYYVYRAAREIGSLVAAMGGLDALVFTAGVGENAAGVREAICRRIEWLGLELDPGANSSGASRISFEGSRVAAWVIPTDEELMIARHTLDCLHLA
jgi:acetate kinase